jgi:hypothetical protein
MIGRYAFTVSVRGLRPQIVYGRHAVLCRAGRATRRRRSWTEWPPSHGAVGTIPADPVVGRALLDGNADGVVTAPSVVEGQVSRSGCRVHRSTLSRRGRWSEPGSTLVGFGASVIDAGLAPWKSMSPSLTSLVMAWLAKTWSISSSLPR